MEQKKKKKKEQEDNEGKDDARCEDDDEQDDDKEHDDDDNNDKSSDKTGSKNNSNNSDEIDDVEPTASHTAAPIDTSSHNHRGEPPTPPCDCAPLEICPNNCRGEQPTPSHDHAQLETTTHNHGGEQPTPSYGHAVLESTTSHARPGSTTPAAHSSLAVGHTWGRSITPKGDHHASQQGETPINPAGVLELTQDIYKFNFVIFCSLSNLNFFIVDADVAVPGHGNIFLSNEIFCLTNLNRCYNAQSTYKSTKVWGFMHY